MIALTFLAEMDGAGTPNYLNGAYAIDVATIGANKIAAIVSYDDNALSLFNIDDPEVPVLTDTIQGTGSPNYLSGACNIKLMEISSNWYAIITSFLDNALTIFDVDDPTAITQTGEIVDGGGSSVLEGAYGLDVVTISGTEYALVTSITDDSLIVIDISNPAAPSESDTLTGAGSPNYLDGAHGVVAAEISSNWYAFVVSYFDNSLTVVDIDNPAAIALTAVVEGTGSPDYLGGAHSIDYQIINAVEYVFISSYDEDTIVVYDVSTPGSPSYVSRLSGGQSPYWLEEVCLVKTITIGTVILAFTTGYLDDAVTALDASDPANLAVAEVVRGAGSPNYLDGAHGLFVDSDNMIATGYNEDTLSIFDLSTSCSSSLSSSSSSESSVSTSSCSSSSESSSSSSSSISSASVSSSSSSSSSSCSSPSASSVSATEMPMFTDCDGRNAYVWQYWPTPFSDRPDILFPLHRTSVSIEHSRSDVLAQREIILQRGIWTFIWADLPIAAVQALQYFATLSCVRFYPQSAENLYYQVYCPQDNGWKVEPQRGGTYTVTMTMRQFRRVISSSSSSST